MNAAIAQRDDLIEILHAFRDNFHPQIAGEIDEGFDDGRGIALGAHGIHEHLVDLDDISAEPEDVGQAIMPGADVVDRDPHADSLQRPWSNTGSRVPSRVSKVWSSAAEIPAGLRILRSGNQILAGQAQNTGSCIGTKSILPWPCKDGLKLKAAVTIMRPKPIS
jgi:hypothetical protein